MYLDQLSEIVYFLNFCHKCNVLLLQNLVTSISCMSCYFAFYFSLAGRKETPQNKPKHADVHGWAHRGPTDVFVLLRS